MLSSITPSLTGGRGGGRAAPRTAAPRRRASACRPIRGAPSEKQPAPVEHFEPADVKVGECLLEDARDAMEACKGLSPEDEAACMLQHGCDARAVHARLDGEEAAGAAADGKATPAAAAGKA